ATGGFDLSPVADVVGIKFQPAGKIYLYDSGRHAYPRGEEVIVESERGPRWGTVASATRREVARRKNLRRVLRRPNPDDLRKRDDARAEQSDILLRAKRIARRLELPVKVFRCEVEDGNRVAVYFSCEAKVDSRSLVRELAAELG